MIDQKLPIISSKCIEWIPRFPPIKNKIENIKFNKKSVKKPFENSYVNESKQNSETSLC
jgi:hypothetical protein